MGGDPPAARTRQSHGAHIEEAAPHVARTALNMHPFVVDAKGMMHQADTTIEPEVWIVSKLAKTNANTIFKCKVFFTSRRNERELVVKIPSDCVHEINPNPNRRLSDLLKQDRQRNVRQYSNLKKEYDHECSIIQRIEEPNGMHGATPGAAPKPMSRFDYHSLQCELHDMHLHEGYRHIHHFVHYDAHIPALFSERADGSLHDIQKAIIHGKHGPRWNLTLLLNTASPPLLWVSIAYQMTLAVDFLNTTVEWSHLDIKPNNILYKLHPGTATNPQIHCMLSDFGIGNASNAIIHSDHTGGTSIYMPPIHIIDSKWTPHQCTYATLSQFELAVTLLDMLYFSDYVLWQHFFIMALSSTDKIIGNVIKRTAPQIRRKHGSLHAIIALVDIVCIGMKGPSDDMYIKHQMHIFQVLLLYYYYYYYYY